ncbi:MAG: proteasome assembly chaperone family protein [Methanosarcinaceae archaeon]|nr:proteasome assembly chaperone family protein [Methanosarcinaceae archaeon]MDD4332403.1 proteasome assembly chaperone family protein [Methanosarcinaceae archaeon]MDD4749389.1 proteasome assembly chaperone family protein [Methanosarcinaceae archaeon]
MSETDYDNNDVKIITKPVKSKNPILIEGFPGIGLVGNIASQHLIEEMDMEYIGSIDSRYFPSIAVLYEGLINMPVRIYESEKHNLIVVISDIPISHSVSYDVSSALVDWAQSINVKEIASIAGIAIIEGPHKVFGAATTQEMLDKIKEKVEIFQMGTISGISGSVMSECLLRELPALSLLGATRTQNPDPRAASAVVEVLNELYGFSVDTERLIKQAERIEVELHKLAEDVQTSEQKGEIKKEFPMYG